MLPDQPLPDVPLTGPQTAPGSALLDDLRTATTEALQKLLEKMFQGADDVLYGMSERAADAVERRHCVETMRLLRMESGAITRRYLQDVVGQFNPLSRPTRPVAATEDSHAEQMEEQIAVINLSSRIKQLHALVLEDWQQRLGQAVRNTGLPLSPQALSARSLCTGFASTLRELDIERQTRLVLYRVFDQLAVGALGLVYQDVSSVLARYGIGSPRIPPAPVTEPAVDEWSVLDANCLQALQRTIETMGPAAVEVLLARELLAIARGKIVAGRHAVMQRMVLAGQVIDSALAQLPANAAARASIEALRYTAIRCALTDAGFLAETRHPLRRHLQDLQRNAGNAGTLPLPRNMAVLASLAALRMMEPLSPVDIRAFRQQVAAAPPSAA